MRGVIGAAALLLLAPGLAFADPKLIICQGLQKSDAGQQITIRPEEGKGTLDVKDADGSFSFPLECGTGTEGASEKSIVCQSTTTGKDGAKTVQMWSIPAYDDEPAKTIFSILFINNKQLAKDHVAAISIYDTNCKAMGAL